MAANTNLENLIGSGEIGDRPEAGIPGRLYIVTDSGLERITRDNGASWDNVVIAGAYAPGTGGSEDYILIRDEKPANTNGGTFTSGSWQTRVLNTKVVDTGEHASLSNNQITLAAGTYRCRIQCPAFKVDRHKAKLYNVTDDEDELIGTSEYARNTDHYGTTYSWIIGRFTIAEATVFEVRHRCGTTAVSTGYGVASEFGVAEIYTVAEFWREV